MIHGDSGTLGSIQESSYSRKLPFTPGAGKDSLRQAVARGYSFQSPSPR